HGHGLELNAVELRPGLQRRYRLLAIGAVVIDQGDLLALEFVEATQFLGDVLDGDVGRRPVAPKRDEIPGEHRTLAAFRTAIAGGQQRDLVARYFFRERKGDARRQG